MPVGFGREDEAAEIFPRGLHWTIQQASQSWAFGSMVQFNHKPQVRVLWIIEFAVWTVNVWVWL